MKKILIISVLLSFSLIFLAPAVIDFNNTLPSNIKDFFNKGELDNLIDECYPTKNNINIYFYLNDDKLSFSLIEYNYLFSEDETIKGTPENPYLDITKQMILLRNCHNWIIQSIAKHCDNDEKLLNELMSMNKFYSMELHKEKIYEDVNEQEFVRFNFVPINNEGSSIKEDIELEPVINIKLKNMASYENIKSTGNIVSLQIGRFFLKKPVDKITGEKNNSFYAFRFYNKSIE